MNVWAILSLLFDKELYIFNRKNNISNSLIAKYVVSGLAVSLLPLIMLYFIAAHYSSKMLIDSLSNELTEESYLVARDIDRVISQRIVNTRILSKADALKSNDIKRNNTYLTEIVSESIYLYDIDLINSSGNVIASSGTNYKSDLHFSNLGPQLNELFLSALQAKQGDVLVLYTVDLDGGPGVAFMAPVISVDSEVVDKVILIEFNLSIIKQIVSEFDDSVA